MKIKQIAVEKGWVFALTEDGRVFMMHAFESQIWKELPAIEEKESNIIDSSLKKNLLCFTPRLQSALKENGIDNMNRLAETPFAELKKMHGIGRGSILEIYRMFKNNGFRHPDIDEMENYLLCTG